MLVMCDARDLGRVVVREEGATSPSPIRIFLYERCAGGTGLSEPIFSDRRALVARARALVAGCGCEDGCPSCIGAGRRGKAVAAGLLHQLEEAFDAPRLRAI
jgi:DEAD/DEAH box helicase domain-containing protein